MPFRTLCTRAFRTRRAKLALSLTLGYLLVEVVALPVLAAYAPLRMRMQLPGPLYVLSQSSKSGLLPHDWTLILGDSYAHGYGDWLADVMRQPGNPAFHSPHVLHELTGEDVMSFGQGGAGSMKGIVFLLEKRLTALKRTGIGDPSKIVVLVYEGNDFIDNIVETGRYGELAPGDDEAALEAHCRDRARSGFLAGIVGTFYFPAVIVNKVKGRKGVRPDAMGTNLLPFDSSSPEANAATNVVRVGGELLRFMGPAQGPPLGLDETELDWSVATLRVSLDWLATRFEGTPIRVVLVPSPLSCYELVSSQLDLDSSGDESGAFDSARLEPCHDDLVERLRSAVTLTGLEFVDATAALRSAAREQPVHGPLDGSHFNRAGYEALGQLLAR